MGPYSSERRAELAASTAVVFRMGLVASIESGDDYSTVRVGDVAIIGDGHADRATIVARGRRSHQRFVVDPKLDAGQARTIYGFECCLGHLLRRIVDA